MTCVPFPQMPAFSLSTPQGTAVFGHLLVEVVTPDGRVTAPLLPDWELRAWPVARLGDATLEARPRRPHLGAEDLAADLCRAGYLPLGPLRATRAGRSSFPSSVPT
ncbi:hypothetical protein [Deinococcus sp. YIM 77859]|uniref:hypothetical protein n=1 Tax=Deinococcus sp. YIM 77859 TaxID=1540221 RepID=UPI00054EF669|nr:hypothetical protein [Deinococcus sp. YIM 77859]